MGEVKMCNNFGSIVIQLCPLPDFREALADTKRKFDSLKSSLEPFGVLYSTKASVLFPFEIGKAVVDDLTTKLSIVFSNLVGSKKQLVWDGKRMLNHFFIAPGV